MNADSADHLIRLFGQGRDVVWWIVGIVFRHVPDMAAITAAVVVHLCVFAHSRKPLHMLRLTGRTSGVGHRGADQGKPISMKIITYSKSHPTITRTGTTTDHLTCVIFIARPDFSGPADEGRCLKRCL
jgi:hypothetical protein